MRILVLCFFFCRVYVPKSSILLSELVYGKFRSVACWFSSIKIDYFEYPKGLISRINDVYVFLLKKTHKDHLSRLFRCNHTCYCVNMVSVTSASRYITSASRYHLRYQSRSSMYIGSLIPQNFVELTEAVPIGREV